jgi:ArsR family transcriptional regulator
MSQVLDQLSALADPIRARLLVVLENHELSVRELQEILQLPQSTVSRHLRVLGDDSWLVSRPDGPSHRYRFSPPAEGSGRERLWGIVREELGREPASRQDLERLKAVLSVRHARSRAFFAGEAVQWDRTREALFGRRYELAALLPLLEPDAVVGDLGCGTGAFAQQVAPFVGRVIAVDESAAMLAAARARLGAVPNVEIREGELELLPINEDALDLAVLTLVLPYVPDPGRVLGEAARAVRPGGRVVVLDLQPHGRVEWEQTMGHLWQGFAPGQIIGWMTGAGLRDPRLVALPPVPEAKGPGLFVASARKPV